MASLFDFCPDIIFEILTRVSLESLDTCKVVCKQWRKIIYQSDFMPIYCQRTKNLSGYYMQNLVAPYKFVSKFVSMNQSEKNGEHVIESLPKGMQILASSNQGILCCLSKTGRYNDRFYVCKPSTKQWQVLPNPKTRYPTISVGLLVLRSRPLRFKIFRISNPQRRPPKHCHHRFEIFDSTMWAWKEANDIILPETVVFETHKPVTVGDSVHWLTSNDHVLAFHEEQECYVTIPLPQSACSINGGYKRKQLMQYQGKLGFMVQESEQHLEIWVMENPKNGAWKKEKIVSISRSFHEAIRTSIPIGFDNTDIAFMKSFYELIFYKSQNHTYEVVKVDEFMDPRESFPFRSDFELVDLKGRC